MKTVSTISFLAVIACVMLLYGSFAFDVLDDVYRSDDMPKRIGITALFVMPIALLAWVITSELTISANRNLED